MPVNRLDIQTEPVLRRLQQPANRRCVFRRHSMHFSPLKTEFFAATAGTILGIQLSQAENAV